MPRVFVAAGLALFALAATGCSSPGPDDRLESAEDDQTAAGDEQGATHEAAIAACDRAFDDAAQDATSTVAMVSAKRELASCVKAANDAAVAKIEANLSRVGSSLRGKTKSLLEAARTSGAGLCAELDDASASFGGTLAQIEAASCRADRERFLARMIDGYVDLGGETVKIPEARAVHEECFSDYDAKIADATTTAAMVETGRELAACVTAEALALAEPLAKAQQQNEAAGDLAAAKEEISAATKAALADGDALCSLFTEAGENGGGSLASIAAAGCAARVAESVHAALAAPLEEGAVGGE